MLLCPVHADTKFYRSPVDQFEFRMSEVSHMISVSLFVYIERERKRSLYTVGPTINQICQSVCRLVCRSGKCIVATWVTGSGCRLGGWVHGSVGMDVLGGVYVSQGEGDVCGFIVTIGLNGAFFNRNVFNSCVKSWQLLRTDNSYTVPIPKLKDCKSMSCDDFRGITISPILSKVFEYCLLDRYGNFLHCSVVLLVWQRFACPVTSTASEQL